MTDNDLIVAVKHRMSKDAAFRQSVTTAINQKNESWLMGLIKETVKNIFTSVAPQAVGEVVKYFLRIWLGR
ncbi:MAG: hypothetical protein FD167_4254 [bacterium]|nr:MAG: hypothetical protein FD167_4254 [bacterium]